MKSATVFCFVSLLGIGACCSLNNGDEVPSNWVIGQWYETDSYGDTLMAILSKCIKNDITASGQSTIQKTRSYKWKLFPFITWNEQSSLINKGVAWELKTSTWFGSSSTAMSIIKQDPNFLILKTCPNTWFTDERIWIYASTPDLQVEQIAAINKALTDKNEPSLGSFRSISQSC